MGDIFHQQYITLKNLGPGGFSDDVYHVRRRSDNAELAIKKVNLTAVDADSAATLRQEGVTMSNLKHPYIVEVFGSFEDTIEDKHFYYLIMQYCEGGNLQHAIEENLAKTVLFGEDQVNRWLNQITSAVKYIHDKGFVHRDIKPANIFLVNSRQDLRLGDFGSAKSLDTVSRNLRCTPIYAPQEFLMGYHRFCKKCDVYSLGATLHQVVSGTLIPDLRGGFPSKTRELYNGKLLSLILTMIRLNPDERPTMEVICSSDAVVNAVTQTVSMSDHGNVGSCGWQVVARITSQWISTILTREEYFLAFGYDGDVVALSKNGDSVLWRSHIETLTFAGIWHAAIDERRHRLLVAFHARVDVLNAASVDVYSADISHWVAESSPGAVIKVEKIFSRRDWQCYSLTILPDKDLIFITDWHNHQLGIWDLAMFQGEAQPKHVISQKEGGSLSKFSPTRCAILPKESFAVSEYFLAVTDWKNNTVLLFTVSADGSEIGHRFEKVIATQGTEVGLVYGPVDVKFDKTTEVLALCDQRNCRVQIMIPNRKWPSFRSKAITESLGHYFSALAIQACIVNRCQSREIFVLAGLSTGEVVRCSFTVE